MKLEDFAIPDSPPTMLRKPATSPLKYNVNTLTIPCRGTLNADPRVAARRTATYLHTNPPTPCIVGFGLGSNLERCDCRLLSGMAGGFHAVVPVRRREQNYPLDYPCDSRARGCFYCVALQRRHPISSQMASSIWSHSEAN